MNLLIINLDKGIFSVNSASLERLKEYSQLVEKLFVIVWTVKKETPINWQDKLFIYPTNSCCRLFYYLDTFRLVRQILKKDKVDLIFTQDPFETGLAGWLAAASHKIKLQIQIHTDFLNPYFRRAAWSNQIRVWLAKFLLSRADGLRVVSQRIRDSLKVGGYKLKTDPVVLPIFVDVAKIKAAWIKTNLKQKYPQFDSIILTAARLSPEKNLVLAIEVMAEIVKQFPRAGLIIVGAGPEERNLRSKIAELKLVGQVILEGWSDDLASYYKTADLFLVTSNYEGWSMTLVEALGAGCPIVTTNVGCAGELIRNGQNGLVVAVGDKAALVAAVKKFLSEPGLEQTLVSLGQETVKNLPTKEQYLSEYKRSWESLI